MDMQMNLEKLPDTYKMIIPAEVEQKIRHLCSKISNVEWSGTLFYTVSGSYENKDLTITCVDIFLMDIGNSTYTEFDMSPDVIAYMAEHPELLDCQLGLIHSHNSMSTFFSGTDVNTLKQEGNDRNHFVSLIVNNEGTYTAAITRKIVAEKDIHTIAKYKSFNDEEKSSESEGTLTETTIQYNYLTITKEGVNKDFDEIDERYSEIKKAKESKKIIAYNNKAFVPSNAKYTPPSANSSAVKSLFDDYDDYYNDYYNYPSLKLSGNKVEHTKQPILDPNYVKIAEEDIKSFALQLLTSSIAISNTSKIDARNWSKQMVPLFDKRFDKDIFLYQIWIETFLGFIIDNFVPEKYIKMGMEDVDNYNFSLCNDTMEYLKTLPKNKYIDVIIQTLEEWIAQI
jgi:proteasome lid subunit RPN8/RPN11